MPLYAADVFSLTPRRRHVALYAAAMLRLTPLMSDIFTPHVYADATPLLPRLR